MIVYFLVIDGKRCSVLHLIYVVWNIGFTFNVSKKVLCWLNKAK